MELDSIWFPGSNFLLQAMCMPPTPLRPNQTERLSLLGRYSILNKIRALARPRDIAEVLPNTLRIGKFVALRKKTRLIFGMALTGLLGALYAASSTILISSLTKAEEQGVRQTFKGVLNVLDQTEEDFSSNFLVWSAWDETYTFIEDGNESYIESNLVPGQLASSRLNLALYIHTSGRIMFGTGFELKEQKKTPIPPELIEHLSANNLLVQHPEPHSRRRGILVLPKGPMMILSHPILTSQGQGPIRGTLIFGRYLDAAEIEKLARITRLPLTVYRLNDPQMPADFQAVRSALSEKAPILIRRLSEQTIAGYGLLTDVYGKPALILRVDMPREIYTQGQSSLHYLIASLLMVGLVFAGITLPLLERLIVFWHERQEREQRYRAVVAQAAEGIFLVNADTKCVLEANAAFENLLGYTSSEVLRLTLYDVVAQEEEEKEEECESIDNAIQHMRTKNYPFIGEQQYYCKNGSLIGVEVSANLISYEEREALCIVIRDITERKRAEEALRESERRLSWQASHDSLTELTNRREFEQLLEQAILSAKTSDHQHVLCYLDLDQFKIINDTCGHVAGDTLLRQISTLFQSQLRQTDVLARLGGDEFGLLLYQCQLEKAVQITNLLREQIREFRLTWQNKTFSVGVSIGLVVINADSPSSANVLSAADAACYAAKNKGRDRVHIYQLNDTELAQQRGEMQWVSRIPKALEENRFRLYYQRIVPVEPSTTKCEHCEVLLRLEDESGDIISPMAFIPAAERYNFMHLIDRWVISTLFAHLRKQHQETGDYSLAQNSPGILAMYGINLSGASINDEQFIDFLQSQFALYRISPSLICFEITETVAITNLGKAAEFISKLQALGCYFALDDFGSGMSSFAYLKNLPVNYLKIDGVFIKDIVSDEIASSMVEAIARIASVMKIQTIAEFVENDAILNKLKALGIDYAQGYGIGKPCPFSIFYA